MQLVSGVGPRPGQETLLRLLQHLGQYRVEGSSIKGSLKGLP